MVTVDVYCLSLAVMKSQIATVLQECKTGCSATLPRQLLRLFVCWVLIEDEFCSASIHAAVWKQFPIWLTPITYLSGNIILQVCDMQSGNTYAYLGKVLIIFKV